MTSYPWPDPESKAVADQRTWSMLPHLAIFANFAIPFGGVIASLIIYSQRSKDRPFARNNQRMALNYGLTVGIVYGCTSAFQFLFGFSSGFFGAMNGGATPNVSAQITHMLPVYVLSFVMAILLLGACVIACFAAHAAWFGRPYRYPIAIPFVGPKAGVHS